MLNKDKIFKQATDAIKKHNLFFIEDIIAFIPCTKETFYKFYPLGSDEMDYIKSLLEENKVKTKSAIRAKLFRSSKSAELLALYKLIGTDNERKALSMNYHDLSNSDGSLTNINVVVRDKQTAEDVIEVSKKYEAGNY